MIDREKVIKGFECCHVIVHDLGPDKSSCGICPYKDVQTEEQIDLGGIECIAVLHDDALALLKEQEEQIKNRDESLEKAREEIKWLRGMLEEQEAQRDYEASVEMAEYCERYEQTYNPDDGSM